MSNIVLVNFGDAGNRDHVTIGLCSSRQEKITSWCGTVW